MMEGRSQGTKFGAEQTFFSLYNKLTEEERFLIGHSFQDMVSLASVVVGMARVGLTMCQVKSCTFRGYDCLAGIGSSYMDYEVRLEKGCGPN